MLKSAREFGWPTRRVARWWPRSWEQRTSSEPCRLLSELDLGFLRWLPIRSIRITIYGIMLKKNSFSWKIEMKNFYIKLLWRRISCRCRKFGSAAFVRPSSLTSCRSWMLLESAREHRVPRRRVSRWWPRFWGRRTTSEPSRSWSELVRGIFRWLPRPERRCEFRDSELKFNLN